MRRATSQADPGDLPGYKTTRWLGTRATGGEGSLPPETAMVIDRMVTTGEETVLRRTMGVATARTIPPAKRTRGLRSERQTHVYIQASPTGGTARVEIRAKTRPELSTPSSDRTRPGCMTLSTRVESKVLVELRSVCKRPRIGTSRTNDLQPCGRCPRITPHSRTV
jgi:hypothetical protein